MSGGFRAAGSLGGRATGRDGRPRGCGRSRLGRSLSRLLRVALAPLAALASVLAPASAGAAEFRILPHPRSVRILLEGISGNTAALEVEGPVAELRVDPPVAVSVPPVPAVARERLVAAEARDGGRLFVFALGTRTRARLSAAGPDRIVLDLEASEEESPSSSALRAADPREANASLAPGPRIRSARHAGFFRILVEGPGAGALALRTSGNELSLAGPAALLDALAAELAKSGAPIAAARREEARLALVLLPRARLLRHAVRPERFVLDIADPARSDPARKPAASTSARNSKDSGAAEGAKTARDEQERPRAATSAARTDTAEQRPCRAMHEGSLCLAASADGASGRLLLLAEPRPRAAAFSSGKTLWLVLDRPLAPIEPDAATIGAGLSGLADDLRIERLSDALLLALAVPDPVAARMEPIEGGWQLLLARGAGASAAAPRPRRARDSASLFLPVDGRPLALPARLLGSDLWVVPTREVSGLAEPLRTADLEFLPSHQGYLLRPRAEDLWLRAEREGVRIGRPNGLRLAPGALSEPVVALARAEPRAKAEGSAVEGNRRRHPPSPTDPARERSEPDTASAARPAEKDPPVAARGREPGRVAPNPPPRAEGASGARGDGATRGSPPSSLPARSASASGPAGSATPGSPSAGEAAVRDARAAAGSSPSEEASRVEGGRSPLAPNGAEGGRRLSSGSSAADAAPEAAPRGDEIGAARGRATDAAEAEIARPTTAREEERAKTEPLVGLVGLALGSDAAVALRRSALLERRARASGETRAALGRELARLELARGNAAEALAFLDDPPAAASLEADPPEHPSARALAGVAAVLSGRAETAERLLDAPDFARDAEVAFWRAAAAARRRDWPAAASLLAASGRTFHELPPRLHVRSAEAVARIHLEAGRTSAALAVVDRALRLDPDPRERQRLRALEAFAHRREGALAQAERAFLEAASGPDRPVALEARFHATVIRYERGAAAPEATLEALERERLLWRDHPAEPEMLDRLFALEREAGRLDAALATACARLARHPGAPGAERLLERARDLFVSLVADPQPRLDPVSALARLRGCPRLSGADERGARTARILAERLAALGLHRVAAELLVEQAAAAPEGALRAELVLEAAHRLHAAGRTDAALALLDAERTSLASDRERAARAEELRARLRAPSAPLRLDARTKLHEARRTGDPRAVARAAEDLLRSPLPAAERRAVALELVAALAALPDREALRGAAERLAVEFEGGPEARFFRHLASQAGTGAEAVPGLIEQELAAARALLAGRP
ncbi:MAG: hypothetical protein RMK73_11780 [Geminicoccaceae bacterium]|nr:hypothetical protein [Geminicoccaceae bacterium]